MLRLSADPAREPPDEPTEYQPGLGREGNVGGHADEDASSSPITAPTTTDPDVRHHPQRVALEDVADRARKHPPQGV